MLNLKEGISLRPKDNLIALLICTFHKHCADIHTLTFCICPLRLSIFFSSLVLVISSSSSYEFPLNNLTVLSMPSDFSFSTRVPILSILLSKVRLSSSTGKSKSVFIFMSSSGVSIPVSFYFPDRNRNLDTFYSSLQLAANLLWLLRLRPL